MALRVAAGVQAAETVIVAVGTILSGIDTARGQSYHLNSGIALTVIGVACVVALAWVTAGLARARRWSRTPALMTQFFVGVVGIYLLQGNRFEWGIPSVGLAILGFGAIMSPASQQALAPDRSQPGGGPVDDGQLDGGPVDDGQLDDGRLDDGQPGRGQPGRPQP